MPAEYIYDVYEAIVDSQQVSGINAMQATHGHRFVTAHGDGIGILQARDKDVAFGNCQLSSFDLANFQTILAAAEGSKITVQADGYISGGTSKRLACSGSVLSAASLTLAQNQYANATFSFDTSWGASDSDFNDKHLYTDQARSNTPIAPGHAYRLNSATLNITSDIIALGVTGFDVRIQGNVLRTFGDTEFGETVDVTHYDVTGTLTFQDHSVSTAKTLAQNLMESTEVGGQLDLVVSAVGGASTYTLSIDNIKFGETLDAWGNQQYGACQISWGIFGQIGTTVHTLAGSNPIIAVA